MRITANPYVFLTLVFLFCFTGTSRAGESIAQVRQLHRQIHQGMFEINLLAVATLSNISVDGLKIAELSGLSWDEDEGLLYALSDNGYILVLQPIFRKGELQDVVLSAGHHLLDDKGRPLKYKHADSEGLAVEHARNGKRGDSRFIVSFERIPRLARYKPDGTFESAISLPSPLEEVDRYRSENNALESVTIHNAYGIIVGTEYPLADAEAGTMNLYNLQGDHWSSPLNDKTSGALVDMTTQDNGTIIALERVYNGLLSGIQTTLHRIVLDGKTIVADRIHTFSPDEGLFNDNFEGITCLGKNRFMMISDDNNHPLKRTILVYFEINERKDGGMGSDSN